QDVPDTASAVLTPSPAEAPTPFWAASENESGGGGVFADAFAPGDDALPVAGPDAAPPSPASDGGADGPVVTSGVPSPIVRPDAARLPDPRTAVTMPPTRHSATAAEMMTSVDRVGSRRRAGPLAAGRRAGTAGRGGLRLGSAGRPWSASGTGRGSSSPSPGGGGARGRSASSRLAGDTSPGRGAHARQPSTCWASRSRAAGSAGPSRPSA